MQWQWRTRDQGVSLPVKKLAGLVLGFVLLLLGVSTGYAAGYQFVSGFKTPSALFGSDVGGEIPEIKLFDTIGDSLQQTPGSLSIRRNAKNGTAFADEYRAGVGVPGGREQRLGTQCFPWELVCALVAGTVATPADRQVDARARGVATSPPGLLIYAPYVRDITPMASRHFALSVIVRNTDRLRSAPATLGYFRSTDPTVTTSDTRVGTDFVARLNPLGSRLESVLLLAPSLPGTYYYAACFTSGAGESEAENNCTAAVAVTVSAFDMDSLSWVADGLTANEAKAREYIDALALVDAAMAQRLAAAPWLADGVSGTELLMLDELAFLAKIQPATAVAFTSVPDSSGRLIANLLKSRVRFLDSEPSRLKQLVSLPWFQDGLSGEEAALVVALSETTLSQEVFADLIADAHVLADTVTLPLAGDVNLYAVSRSQERLAGALATMEVAVESMEHTTGIPWPSPNVVLLQELETTLRATAGGWYAGTHFVVQDTSRRLAYHELAHYYTFDSPKWLVEGMADFLMLHALREGTSAIAGDITAIAEACAPHGSGTIHGWNKTKAGSDYCPYLLGRQFLNRLFRVLGRQVVSSALRELYEDWAATGSPASEDEIYQAFLTNTPPSKQDDFRLWYQRLHGRPIPD